MSTTTPPTTWAVDDLFRDPDEGHLAANRLEEAARVLRERAEAATPGPWEAVEEQDSGPLGVNEWAVWMPDAGHDGALVERERDAHFIATIDPLVALALADWLDDTANEVESHATYSPDALRVADLILGNAA